MKIEMGFESVDEGINSLIADLDKISNYAKEKICKEAVEGAVAIVFDEEKRILAANPKYSGFAKQLSCTIQKNRHSGYTAYCGYSTEVIKNNIEVLIIEYGRPGHGKKALKKHGRDIKGRKIGVVQPYSHIRAAWFVKKDEVQKFLGDYTFEQIRKVWVKKNGK